MGQPGIAYFVTPHGFGHATRASAVMSACQRAAPGTRFEIFTRVPEWLFAQSLDGPFGYHELQTDIGLAQRDALHEDIGETLRRLDAFLPFDSAMVQRTAQEMHELNCNLVICDIAPLGIAVARAAGLPSLLVENFTWDWIYEGYLAQEPRLQQHIDYLRDVFTSATYHVQTEPVCVHRSGNMLAPPVSRASHEPASRMRERLGITMQRPLVLITMGGLSVSDTPSFSAQLAAHPDVTFLIPGGDGDQLYSEGHIIHLPHHSAFYHPDLVNASDALVGKTGYSTVAEAYHAGVPYGYVSRPHFPESGVMASYIQAHMRGLSFEEQEFRSGAWLARLPELLELGRIARHEPNGAEQVAGFVSTLFR